MSTYPETVPSTHELREPHALPEPARGTGLEHFARIRRWELRALGLVPKSDVVAITKKIKKKIAARGITLQLARRIIEQWEYQCRSDKEARSVERYKQIEGKWYMAVVYVPDRNDKHPHNSLASIYRRDPKEVEELIADDKLRRRKEEK